MQITLNKNSWHFRYYKFVLDDSEPKSLCPYFWTLLGIIIIAPILIPCLWFVNLLVLFSDWDDSKPKKNKSKPKPKPKPKFPETEEDLNIWIKKMNQREKIGKIVFYVFLIFILFLIGLGIHYTAKKIGWFLVIKNTFALIGLIGTMVGICYLWLENEWENEWVNKLKNKIINLSIIKMIKGMIKSTYEKACPIIKWED